jgi:hypothetical protein
MLLRQAVIEQTDLDGQARDAIESVYGRSLSLTLTLLTLYIRIFFGSERYCQPYFVCIHDHQHCFYGNKKDVYPMLLQLDDFETHI